MSQGHVVVRTVKQGPAVVGFDFSYAADAVVAGEVINTDTGFHEFHAFNLPGLRAAMQQIAAEAPHHNGSALVSERRMTLRYPGCGTAERDRVIRAIREANEDTERELVFWSSQRRVSPHDETVLKRLAA